MASVGAFEAKTHFAQLLERVARGEQIVITEHGRPLAKLVPVGGRDEEQVREEIVRWKSLRRGQELGDVPWRELRDQGRR